MKKKGYIISPNELRHLYWAERKSSTKIAEMFGVDSSTVCRWMHKFGIPPRTSSESRIGWHHSKEAKKKISKAMQGERNPMYGRPVWLGRHHTEETKEKMRQAASGKHPSDEAKEKNRRAHLGRRMSEKTKTKISKKLKGRKFSDAHKNRIGAAVKERLRKKPLIAERNPFYGKSHTPKTLELLSKKAKERLKDPEYKERLFKKVLKACLKKPNKKEQILIDLIDEHGLPFKYVGDGEFILGGKCPDFLNYNGEKQLIELWGDYWHRNDDPQERMDFFRHYGFETLIIWERELKNPEAVVEKVRSFTGVK